MTAKPQHYHHIIAFEIAKHGLTLHILPSGDQETIPNTPAAVRRILRREERRNTLGSLGAMLIVCEATGGYERHVLGAAVALCIPLHRAHGVAHALLRPLSGAGQDRPDRCAHAGRLWPRYAGLAPLHPAAAAGISVARTARAAATRSRR